jgi:hypothetical protein
VEVISSCHVDVEEEILNPYGWVSCPIVLLYVYGFKPFWELMLHYLICKAQWVCGASNPSYSVPMIGGYPSSVLFPIFIVVEPRPVPFPSVG